MLLVVVVQQIQIKNICLRYVSQLLKNLRKKNRQKNDDSFVFKFLIFLFINKKRLSKFCVNIK